MDFLKQTNFRYIVIIIIIILAVINLCKINSQENFMNLLEDQNLGGHNVMIDSTDQVMFGDKTLTHKLTNIDTSTGSTTLSDPTFLSGGGVVSSSGEMHLQTKSGNLYLLPKTGSAVRVHYDPDPNGWDSSGDLFVGRNLTVDGELGIESTLRKKRANNRNLHIVSDKTLYLMGKEDVRIYKCTDDCESWDGASGNLIVENDLNVQGNLTCPGSISFLPRGCVIMFSGSSAPAGWAVCNGLDDTPDLRGRFVLGSGGNRNNKELHNTGGEETVTLTKEQMPSHNHGVREHQTDPEQTYTSFGSEKFPIFDGQPGYNIVNSNSTGGDKPHNNMPPYYVLLYIMKL